MNVEMETLKKARAYARRHYDRLRKDRNWQGHAGHAAAEALRLTEEEFDLGTFGVEGFCDQAGEAGFSYLNTGDTYALTVGVYTDYRHARFVLRSWGDVAEANPSWS